MLQPFAADCNVNSCRRFSLRSGATALRGEFNNSYSRFFLLSVLSLNPIWQTIAKTYQGFLYVLSDFSILSIQRFAAASVSSRWISGDGVFVVRVESRALSRDVRK